MRTALVFGILVVIMFFNVIGLPANITNRWFSQNLIVRYALTDNEMELMKHITPDTVAMNGSILGTDSYYASYIQSEVKWYWPQRTKVRSIDEYILNGNYSGCPYNMIVLRRALASEPYGYGNGSIYRLTYDPVEYAVKQGYKLVWDNGEITCLIRN